MRGFKSLASEPLIQFLLIGLVMFIAHDRLLDGNNPRRIVVDDARLNEIRAIFEEAQGRAPSTQELDDLLVRWVRNEVLFREALKMGLDQGDDMIRSRLILKIRNILFDNLGVETPPDAVLQTWFEENRDAYDLPALYSFEQFRLEDGVDREQAEQLAQTLGSAPPQGRHAAALRRYARRPEVNLSQVFGADDTRRLLSVPDHHWTVLSSVQGLHLARITERFAADPAEFDATRARVMRDWEKSARQLQLARALKKIHDKYDIRYEVDRQPADIAGPDADPAHNAGLREPGRAEPRG
ncbi:MAG: peptidyl-prolyl cis-trans isomerase [Gammaproteobacteria bacterium]|nr:peptidyl-prolyl cis-trans isomerase [Gammaproteobacteria bacterium]